MLIIIISRSGLKLGQQATQVRDLGPLWRSCSFFVELCPFELFGMKIILLGSFETVRYFYYTWYKYKLL